MNFNLSIEPYTPFLSIIIPVYNSYKTLGDCLYSIKDSDYSNYEIIIVNDASTDKSIIIAEEFGCKIINLEKNYGANHARNIGAESAAGEILVFIDSDVVLRDNTLHNIVKRMRNKRIGSVVGIYAWEYRHENFLSQYKSLWIRYSYLKSSPQIDWVFGAISSIRREIFFEIGGFDYRLIARDGNDDIELGKRFARLGYFIYLDPKVEVFHLKKYNYLSLFRNEFYRSFGFAKLATALGETTTSFRKGFVNIYPSFIVGTIFSVFLILLLCSVLFIKVSWWIFVSGILIYLIINIRFLNFFEQVRGFFAMIVVIPVLYLDQLICFIGACLGVASSIFIRFRKFINHKKTEK
jgi:glycosyltransferase involved in cell wall biosynthesis